MVSPTMEASTGCRRTVRRDCAMPDAQDTDRLLLRHASPIAAIGIGSQRRSVTQASLIKGEGEPAHQRSKVNTSDTSDSGVALMFITGIRSMPDT
jgi:hypothetical protein